MMTATDMQPRAPHAHKLQSHKAQTRSRTAEHINATMTKGGGGWLQCGKLMKLCREILSMPHNLLVAGQLQLLLPPHEKEITISLWHTPFGQSWPSWPQRGTGTIGTTHTDTIIIKSP